MVKTLRGAGRRFQLIWLAPVLALLALTSWAVASPIGASPDDDFHLASSWCGLGDRVGLCEPADDPSARLIPAEIATSAICYAFKPDESAGCQAGYGGFEAGDFVYADRGNFSGLYPPLFYATTGLLASANVEASAIAMRILSAAIFVAFATALFILLPAARRRTLTWAWLVSIIPLGMFIVASNNPSAWAVISAGSLWIAILGYFESTGRRRVALGVIAVLAAFLGAGARSDSAVYSVLAAVVALALCFETTRRYLLLSILPVAVIAISLTFYLTADQGSIAVGESSAPAREGVSSSTLVLANLLNLPTLWAGVFGASGLGWLDTPMPGVVSVGSLVCFAVVAFAGLRVTSVRKGLALALIGLALIVFPSYVLYQAQAVVGAQVQPRYILPLIIMLTGVCLVAVNGSGLVLSTLQRNVVTVTLIIAHAAALHFNIRRYVSGLDVGNWNLNDQVEWWWSWGGSPMLVWVVGALSFAGTAWIISRQLPATDEAEASVAKGLSRFASEEPTLRS